MQVVGTMRMGIESEGGILEAWGITRRMRVINRVGHHVVV